MGNGLPQVWENNQWAVFPPEFFINLFFWLPSLGPSDKTLYPKHGESYLLLPWALIKVE